MPLRFAVFVACSLAVILSCGSDPTSPQEQVMDVSGPWTGTWESTTYSNSGTLTAMITQNGANISGTIDIPDAGITNLQVTGTVTDNSMAFGDLSDQVQFTGTIAADTMSASGTYTNSSQSDQGTWNMEKASGQYCTYSDSIALDFPYFSGVDIAGAGSTLWLSRRGSYSVYSIDLVTGAMDSITGPGYDSWTLSYDGENLLAADTTLKKIVKLDVNDPSLLTSQDYWGTNSMAFDGSGLWCIGDSDRDIYHISLDGTVLGSFDTGSLFDVAGLAWDGTYLWYCGSGYGSGTTDIYQVDTSGNIISSFQAPADIVNESAGLAWDGQHLWYCSGAYNTTVYELSTTGTVLSSFSGPQGGNDLAWDGTNLWLACGGFSGSEGIYCLNTSGGVVTSIDAPCVDAAGLAYDGTHLWCSDLETTEIYRLDTDGDNFIDFPSFQLEYLAYDGSHCWANDDGSDLICSFDKDGNILNSFDAPCDDVNGLNCSGGDIWVLSMNDYFGIDLYRMDTDGSIVEHYMVFDDYIEPMGLADDGSSPWFIGWRYIADTYYLYKIAI